MNCLELDKILLEDKPSKKLDERKEDLFKFIPELKELPSKYDFKAGKSLWTKTLEMVDSAEKNIYARLVALYTEAKPFTNNMKQIMQEVFRVDLDSSRKHKDISELATERDLLFAALCNKTDNFSFKSKKYIQDEGQIPSGYFIAGIYTPEGIVTYQIREELWDCFDVLEVKNGIVYMECSEEEKKERLESLLQKKKPYVKRK